jgi:surfeit locus 1 family protein
MDHVPSQPEHDGDAVDGDGRPALSRFRRALFVTLSLIAAAGFMTLGIWQVERRAWKLDLIARVEARVHAAPASLPAPATWSRFDARAEEYRRVTVTGTFLHDRSTPVQALTERGAGFWILTPLRTGQGIVLVNRGFVPDSLRFREPAAPGPVRITGLLRATEPKGGFLRANDPVANWWYSRDVAAVAAARGVGPAAPFFIDADATPNPGGYPLGGLTVIRFRNSHLVYALTWFALAALSGGAAVLALRMPGKQ